MPRKKPTRKQLVNKLDKVYSLYIRNKYANDRGEVKCVTCDKWKPISEMQNGHFVSRGKYPTRWLDKNCHPQCVGCNVFLGGNYVKYASFMVRTYGPEVLDELILLSNQILKISNSDLEEKIARY